MRIEPGAGWLARRWLRRRATAVIPLALLVAVGVAGTAVALATTLRTDRAYAEHLSRSGVGDVLVNPVVNSAEIDAVIRSLPNLDEVTSSVLLTASADDGAPRTRRQLLAESGSFAGNVIGSVDGRFDAMDRPVVQAGRLPERGPEIAITQAVAEAEGLGIGGTVTLSVWADNVSTGDAIDGYLDEVISPLGVEELTIVGIVTPSDEVLPDDLYRPQRAIVSPDVVARYDCLPEPPPPGSTLTELHEALLPAGCAVRYRFYSLGFSTGSAGVAPALDALIKATGPLNVALASTSELPDGEVAPIYRAVSVETAAEQQRVERAIGPTVTALAVLAAAAAIVTLALVALAIARELRHTETDRRQWHQLGVSPRVRVAAAISPLVAAVGTGVLAGLVVTWAISPGPQGLVAVLEPTSPRRLEPVIVLAATALGVAMVVTAVLLAWRHDDLAIHSRTVRPMGSRWRAPRIGSPAVADGVRAALTARNSAPVLAAGVILAAVLTATIVFAASLSALLSTPASYGWRWDVARVNGYGYYGLDVASTVDRLEGDPAVVSWAALGFTSEVSVEGRPLPALVDHSPEPGAAFTLIEGDVPRGRREVALASITARELGVEVGDTVQLTGLFDDPYAVTVTGIVVLPALGPFEADRAGPGSGVLVPAAVLDVSRLDERVVALSASFVGIELDDQADSIALRDALRDELRALDYSGFPEVDRATPVRPPEIIDASASQAIPGWVIAVFAAVTAAGMAFVTWSTVRGRRRELAVLRALGFRRAQVRLAVVVTALTMTLSALVVGVPIGVVTGRVLWRGFADRLGVLPDPASPWLPALAAITGGLVLTASAALVPAYLATRSTPAHDLRRE